MVSPTINSVRDRLNILFHSFKDHYQVFQHTIDIGLKDSNVYGNTYFSRYFEGQGLCILGLESFLFVPPY